MEKWIPIVASLAAVGCVHPKPEVKRPAPAVAAARPTSPPPAAPAAAAEQTCSRDLDCGSKQLCIRAHCVDITPDLAECGIARVHFAYGSAQIDEADRAGIDRSARCLKADHDLHVSVEGNTDERGTDEYNMALGDQRATAVARYLRSLGVSDDQLKTVSYGKEHPLCPEHDEACWAKNRRASIKPRAEATRKQHVK